jgi:hypothetical protein
VDIVEYFVTFQVGPIRYLVVYQAGGQHLSGTLEAGAMHQAERSVKKKQRRSMHGAEG